MSDIAHYLYNKVSKSNYHLFNDVISKFRYINFKSGLRHLRVYPNKITEVCITPDCEAFYQLISSSYDYMSPKRELSNYQYLPRQALLSNMYHMLNTQSNYKNHFLSKLLISENDILSTTYYNNDGSISSFGHFLDNRMDAYQYINNPSYVLALMDIENKIHQNQNLIRESTYKKSIVQPMPFIPRVLEDNYIKLTKTEKMIVRLILKNSFQSKRIALDINRSYRTVEEHIENIKYKFNVTCKYNLVKKLHSHFLYIK
ncbi:LuxR C-terminal-related transcriptional regulator [Thiotrichales bacterium 19X7-9]|nr:LuxR C-terminal-related transcriptional regulator [Thiotrichales bacterium 19X7-9]